MSNHPIAPPVQRRGQAGDIPTIGDRIRIRPICRLLGSAQVAVEIQAGGRDAPKACWRKTARDGGIGDDGGLGFVHFSVAQGLVRGQGGKAEPVAIEA